MGNERWRTPAAKDVKKKPHALACGCFCLALLENLLQVLLDPWEVLFVKQGAEQASLLVAEYHRVPVLPLCERDAVIATPRSRSI